jgi:GntR family transcriptional repressor for pyruvate dehydrogenase complex
MEMITEYLLSGELKPGDQLPTEIDFAQKLEVGRNSVREAIKMLSSIGVVEIRRGAGTFIAESISTAMLNPLILSLVFEQGTSRELVQLRILLDTGAAELALEQMNEEGLARLDEANRKLKEARDRGPADAQLLRDLDLGFHRTLLELSGNRLLIKIGQAIYTLFFASIENTVLHDPLLAYDNHLLVIEALRDRDLDLVRRRIRQSLAYWIESVSRDTNGGKRQ